MYYLVTCSHGDSVSEVFSYHYILEIFPHIENHYIVSEVIPYHICVSEVIPYHIWAETVNTRHMMMISNEQVKLFDILSSHPYNILESLIQHFKVLVIIYVHNDEMFLNYDEKILGEKQSRKIVL